MFLLVEPPGAREGVESILDPLARSEAAEAAESKIERRQMTTAQRIARVLGAAYWKRKLTLLDPAKRVAATYWLAFDRPRILCDVLPRGAKASEYEWRAELARVHGYRHVAFVAGQPVDEAEIRRAAGKE